MEGEDAGGCHAGNALGLTEGEGLAHAELLLQFVGQPRHHVEFQTYRNPHLLCFFELFYIASGSINIPGVFHFRLDVVLHPSRKRWKSDPRPSRFIWQGFRIYFAGRAVGIRYD